MDQHGDLVDLIFEDLEQACIFREIWSFAGYRYDGSDKLEICWDLDLDLSWLAD